MDLDRVSITIRPRNPWEAIDLGCLLARQWFSSLWRLWLCLGLPVVLFVLLVPGIGLQWRLLLFWCLKPLFEPLLLFWLSRAVFGEILPIMDVLKQWRSVLLPGLLYGLTLRRFSPERSFLLPIQVLEGAKGAVRSERITVLSKSESASLWLTAVCFMLEIILTGSILLVISMLIPDALRQGSLAEFLFKSPWLNMLVYTLAVSCIAPMYVAGGFMLYISRRVDLEAWDIEIGFKKIAGRAAERKKQGVTMLMTVLLMSGVFLTNAAEADVAVSEIPPPEQCREVVGQVLDGKDFGRKETVHYWKKIEKEEKEKEVTGFMAWLKDFFEAISKGLGELFSGFAETLKKWTGSLASFSEVLLWAVVGGGICWLLYRYTSISQLFTGYGGKKIAKKAPAEVLFGMVLTPESLPDDIAEECRRLLSDGKLRCALALLYQGSLSRLLHEYDLPVPASATEMECNQLVRRYRGEQEAGFFNNLTLVWLSTAYGHSFPEQESVAELIGQWTQFYGRSHEE